MPPTFAHKQHQPRPAPPEALPQLEIVTPAGEAFVRPAGGVLAVESVLADIDQVTAEQRGLPTASYAGAVAAHNTLQPSAEEQVATTLKEALAAVEDEHRQSIQELLGLLLANPPSQEAGDNAWVFDHEYSHSTELIRRVGEYMLKGLIETPEGRAQYHSLQECFLSALIEMLHTDHEFREILEIRRRREHVMLNNHMMAFDGKTSMGQVCENGHLSALAEAATNPQMIPVAEKCGADVRNIARVNALKPGQGFVGLSMDLKEAMQRYGAKFYNDLGFREGVIFLQGYARIDEHTVVAFAYSVDKSDKALWQKIWNQFGGQIPDDWETPTSLDHPIYMNGSPEELLQRIMGIKAAYYQEIGDPDQRHSADEFMAVNRDIATDIFTNLYLKLGTSLVSAQKDQALQWFIEGLLAAPQALHRNIQNHLYNLAPREQVDDKDIALLEQLVRYAAVERMRGALALFRQNMLPRVEAYVSTGQVPPLVAMLWNLAAHVLDGARHRRSYGGCTRGIDMSADDPLSQASGDKKPGEDGEEAASSSESYVTPSQLRCIKCKKTSPKEKVIKVKNGLGVWECPHCRYWVDVCDPTKSGYRSKEAKPATAGEALGALVVWLQEAGRPAAATPSPKKRQLQLIA